MYKVLWTVFAGGAVLLVFASVFTARNLREGGNQRVYFFDGVVQPKRSPQQTGHIGFVAGEHFGAYLLRLRAIQTKQI
jgi:hypothetical protein